MNGYSQNLLDDVQLAPYLFFIENRSLEQTTLLEETYKNF